MTAIGNFFSTNWGLIGTALFALSEVLALIPAVKSNSVFQLLYNLIGKLWTKTTL